MSVSMGGKSETEVECRVRDAKSVQVEEKSN